MNTKYNSVKHMSFKVNNIKEDLSMLMFNRSFTLAQAGKQCVVCGERANIFSCDRAEREFKISSMCETCQNEVFEPIEG
jgi:CRISPR/Cas system-associated protein Cas10 (large subunit of type III CRISPR-Cas system)